MRRIRLRLRLSLNYVLEFHGLTFLMAHNPHQPLDSNDLAQRVWELLSLAEHSLTTGDPADLSAGAKAADDALDLLKQTGSSVFPASTWVSAWLLRANLERERNPPASISFYDQSLDAAEGLDLNQDKLRNLSANVWINRGMALLLGPSREEHLEALRCFDQAIALRLPLDLDQNVAYRWGVIAAWMNRADALSRLGEPDQLKEAVVSYDKALEELRKLPLRDNLSFRTRFAVAFMNRALVCHRLELPEAKDSLLDAIAILRQSEDPQYPEHLRTLACVQMNLARLLLYEDFEGSRTAAQRSLELIGSQDRTDIAMADFALQARTVLAHALAELLSANSSDAESGRDLLSEATDNVEAALELARHWRAQGDSRFQPLLQELFRFCCRVYRLHQPHFLPEFTLEVLDPSVADEPFLGDLQMLETAEQELNIAMAVLQESWKEGPGSPQDYDRWSELRETLLRLGELKSSPALRAGAC